MAKALILNATEEPLSVVPGRRAALLVLEQKADVIVDSDHVLRSTSLEVRVPSVVRLRYFVRVPYRRSRSCSRRGVMVRDAYRCQYCSARADSIDHIQPRSRGGEHTWENVVAACRRCNTKKRDKLPKEIGMKLRRSPMAPPAHTLLVLGSGMVPTQWEPYVDLAWRETG